jgi:P27 family predicted phage terminase small subunit
MAGGRRRTNLAKLRTNTLRKGRGPKADMAARLFRAVPPPANMSERAKAEWKRLMPVVIALGTMSRCDLRAFQLLCETLATATEAAELVAKQGMTIPTGSGGRKAHPALRVLADARRHAGTQLESFGLTPKGRQSVDVLPANSPGRDLADRFFRRDPLLGLQDSSKKYFS